MIQPVSEDGILQMQGALRLELGLDSRDERESAPAPINVVAAKLLDTTATLDIRGALYVVPPMSWSLGADLQLAYLEMVRLSKYSASNTMVPEFKRQMLVICDLMFKAVRPARPLQRVLYHVGWLRNPFLEVSEGEVGALMGFFLQHRTKYNVSNE